MFFRIKIARNSLETIGDVRLKPIFPCDIYLFIILLTAPIGEKLCNLRQCRESTVIKYFFQYCIICVACIGWHVHEIEENIPVVISESLILVFAKISSLCDLIFEKTGHIFFGKTTGNTRKSEESRPCLMLGAFIME